MSVKILKQAHDWFYNERGFQWISDFDRLQKIEHWEILTNKTGVFSGDCDDAALTVMNKMLSLGADKDKLFIIRCATELCPLNRKFDHAVLAYIDDGRWYFSDNRYPQYPALLARELLGYRLYDAISIDNFRGNGRAKLIINGVIN